MTVGKPNALKEQYLAADLQGMAEIESTAKKSKEEQFPLKIIWERIVFFIALHIVGAIGLFQLIFLAKWQTVFWSE